MKKKQSSRAVLALLIFYTLLVVTCKGALITTIEESVDYAITPPEVTDLYPDPDAADVPTNSYTSITFSKPLDENSLTADGFVVAAKLTGERVPGSLVVSSPDTVTFTPSPHFEYSTTYKVTIGTSMVDKDGNPVPAGITWEFSTGLAPDVVAPVGNSVTINSGDAWTTSHSVQLTFDATDNYGIAKMNISNIPGVFSDGNWIPYTDPYTWDLVGDDGMHTVYVKFMDGAGNYTPLSVSDSVMLDTAIPQITYFEPNGGASATNTLSVSLGITGEDAEASSGVTGFQYRKEGDPWPAGWTAFVEENALVTGVDISSSVSQSGDIQIFESRIRDLAGNVSGPYTTSIEYDLNPPTILQTSPLDGDTTVPADSKVVSVVFNEEMDISSFTIDTLYVFGPSGVVPGTLVFEDDGDINLAKVSITGLEFEKETGYFVHIKSEIRDVAGNEYGTDDAFWFQTSNANDVNPPTGSVEITGFIGTLPGNETAVTLPDGTIAVNHTGLRLGLTAVDDYNQVREMNFWGDGDLPFSYSELGWEPFVDTKDWTLDLTEKRYKLWYRLKDDAFSPNTSDAVQFSVVLDTSPPTVSDIAILNSTTGPFGYTYVNDPDGRIDLLITADDEGGSGFPGSGIQYFALSNDGTITYPDDLQSWNPLIQGWLIDDSVEGQKTLYLDIQDFLTNAPAGYFTKDFYYDVSAPTLEFDFDAGDGSTDMLEVNTATAQTGTFDDNVVGFNGITIDDLTYGWEQVGGSGEVIFSDTAVRIPLVSASVDGTYILRATVADPAGNVTNATIPFTWDETPPDPMSAIFGPSNPNGNFSRSSIPEFYWDPVPGATSYFIELEDTGGAMIDTLFTSQTGYTTSWDLEEGVHWIYVNPRDTAGNFSDTATYEFTIDTIEPVITNAGQLFLMNSPGGVDYTGVDGTASDSGSGIDTVQWSQTDGPVGGTLGFTPDDALATTLSADIHGYYGVSLTVTDLAGNIAVANFSLNWDIVAPNAPDVSGIDHTPNLRPTWSWSTGGNGGSGNYRYRLDNGAWLPDEIVGTTATSFTPASDLSAGNDEGSFTHLLEVQERDEVGNWSSTGSHYIWVDNTYVAAPEVTQVGNPIRNTTSIHWDWTSGAAQTGATYRWRINGGAWIPSDLGAAQQSYDFTAPTAIGEDELFTIEVEEYSSSLFEWLGELDGKYGLNAVRVDRMGPVAPTVYNISSTPTNDTTPTWGWYSTAGADGTGIFRYDLNSAGWSAATSQTVFTSSVLTDDAYILEVQEQDSLGNWGVAGNYTIEVDTTPPAFHPSLPSIVLESPSGNETYTGSVSVTATINVAAAETGMQMRFYDYNPGWTSWEPYAATKAVVLPSTEGTRRVYVQLMDAVGNATTVTTTYSDTIILDQTSPENISVTLNSGDFYTPSLDTKISISASDNYASLSELELRYYYNGVWSGWYSYSDPFSANTNFTPASGYKYVYVQVRDPAGNETPIYDNYDYIYLQVPQTNYALKGYYTYGATTVYYNPLSEPTGSNSTYYYTYYSTDPAADPNSGDPVTYLANTTNTSAHYVNNIPTGQLLYFFVRPYNADSGGWGAFSNGVLGFSSNVTIVYDDDESADIDRADQIRVLLENPDSVYNVSYVTGSVAPWTVTLLPEDLISGGYSSSEMIYGDPVIITTGSTFNTGSSYDGVVRNIAASGRGIIAMGSVGGSFLYRVDQMWSSWGLTGTRPSAIDSGNQMGLTSSTDGVTRPYNISETIWHTPLRHDYFYANFYATYTNNSLFTTSVSRRGVYISTGANPPDGAIYAGDPNYSYHFPVVRQGRFLFYGFNEIPNTLNNRILFPIYTPARAGKVFFLNLISRMDNF